MFVTKDEIRRMVKQVITDDVNNDIVFIVANKGFGKYKLLKEINGYEYQKHVIITNGEQFHSASLVKNCLMHGIYEYLRRNNILDQRKYLRLLIKKRGKKLPISSRIAFDFHIKLTTDEIEDILKEFSITELIDIYREFTLDSPLVLFIRGTELSDSERNFLCSLKTETGTIRFTYIIALRPDTAGINFIKSVTQKRNERIWICPLIPRIREKIGNRGIVNIPLITLNDVKDSDSYRDLKTEISSKDYYNPVFELVDHLLDSGINPSMIFTIASQEISRDDFDYINSLTIRLLHEPKASPYNDALVAHNGKFMWIDALGYYLFVNEGIEELLLEMQKFYFAFLIDTNKWKNVSSNSFSYAEIEPNRDERNRMNQFLKRMSQISGNPIIPEISRYTARLSDWIRVFSRPAMIDKVNITDIDSMVDELYSFCVGFSEINIEALQIISRETGRLGALDIGLLVTARKLQTNALLNSDERMAINKLIASCFDAILRWNDITMANEVCEVLYLLQKNEMLDKYYIPEISNNHSMYKYLSKCMENKNLIIGEIVMGRKTIFISYTDADERVVDVIDSYLSSCGYDVKRDIRNIGDYESIDEFMNEIRNQDFVVPIVSDTYLRRNNCMYEITQLLKDDNFTKRTLPVIISLPKTKDRTYSFFDPRYRIEIIRFWENEAKTLKEAIEKLSLENKVELSMEYRRINNYSQDVSKFMNWFKSKLVGVIPSDTSASKRKQAALEIADKIDNIIGGKQ
ncbi:MAG TPA: hypothetical protein DFI63_00215 [Lachnospiraceae bacterium]|nr:hypothetical protein [Lachnospiraceae bacterium]